MLHACLYPICFVFCYTSRHFYAFSGTNLLMRRHSASSLFSAVFVFQKSYTGNILGIGRNKIRTIYFYRSFTKTEDKTEGGHRLVHLLTPSFRLYIPLDGKNLKSRLIFLKTYCKPPPSSTQDREGPEALPGTLSERGIPAGGLLHLHGRLRSDV
jgi:hypothetical protein